MTMGEKILALRKARGWSQEELAERIGVTRQAVSRWESGAAKPDADKTIAVCDLFGVSADYLLRDQYSGESSPEQPEQRSVNVLAAKVQAMTLHQWYACGAALAGGIVLFVLKLVYIFLKTDYYYQDIYGGLHTGYQGFLQSEELLLVWWVSMAAFFGGLFYLFILPIIRKDRERKGGTEESD